MQKASCSPFLKTFLESRPETWTFAQILVERCGEGHSLRHIQDVDRKSEDLRPLTPEELAEWVIFDDRGAFRPLKAAPTLRSGWICHAPQLSVLERALESIYPGAIADWVASVEDSPEITDFRTFTNRQTGMYRNAKNLSDLEAREVVNATCHSDSCLKVRRWDLEGPTQHPPAPDMPACMEPCAILLEMARKRHRFNQTPSVNPGLSEIEWSIVQNALKQVAKTPVPDGEREADLSYPGNPRLARLVLERLSRSEPDPAPGT